MNYQTISLIAIAGVFALLSLQALNAQEAVKAENKPVAWYVANIKQAQKQNQLCHDNVELQGSEDCANALHALQISFKGNN